MRIYSAQELQQLYDLCRELDRLIWEAADCEEAQRFFRQHPRPAVRDGLARARAVHARLLDAIDDMDLAALRRELRKAG